MLSGPATGSQVVWTSSTYSPLDRRGGTFQTCSSGVRLVGRHHLVPLLAARSARPRGPGAARPCNAGRPRSARASGCCSRSRPGTVAPGATVPSPVPRSDRQGVPGEALDDDLDRGLAAGSAAAPRARPGSGSGSPGLPPGTSGSPRSAPRPGPGPSPCARRRAASPRRPDLLPDARPARPGQRLDDPPLGQLQLDRPIRPPVAGTTVQSTSTAIGPTRYRRPAADRAAQPETLRPQQDIRPRLASNLRRSLRMKNPHPRGCDSLASTGELRPRSRRPSRTMLAQGSVFIEKSAEHWQN